MKIKDIYSTS
jgi:DNA-directed RNA polymerase alpha subunit